VSELRLTRQIFITELRRLVRDKRAIFSAVILPALLYPFILWGSGELETISQETQRSQDVNVAYDLQGSQSEWLEALRAGLTEAEPITLTEVDAEAVLAAGEITSDPTPEQVAARHSARVDAFNEVTDGAADLLVITRTDPEVEDRLLVQLVFDVQEDASREARERAMRVLRQIEREARVERRDSLLGGDPAASLSLELIDLATEEDRGGDLLGRLLPLITVLILVSGGAYAALTVFAGEREQGTLETLLVQPVPVRAVTYGKYGAVLVAGLVTVAVNLGSLAACTMAGLTGGAGGLTEGSPGVSLGRSLMGLTYLPGCALVCAILCLVCGRARSFRAGQHALLPITLLTAIPTAIVLQPDLVNTPFLASIPLSGAALTLRDALRGDLAFGSTLAMFLSHIVWTALVLARLAFQLEPERSLHGADDTRDRPDARRAIAFGFVALLAMYLVGARLQAINWKYGLVATLVILLPTVAVAMAWTTGRARKESIRQQFWLRIPHPLTLLGAALITPALTQLIHQLIPLQEKVLPFPRSMMESAGLEAMFMELGGIQIIVLMALLPAVFEEFLFRGTLLPALRRDLRPLQAAVWSAGLFAVAHLSLHRVLPTFSIGLVCAALALRARSVWPAVVVHLIHNAGTVLSSEDIDTYVGWSLPEWYLDPRWAFGVLPLGILCIARGTRSASSRLRETP
jgi:sodium transport system permease protein